MPVNRSIGRQGPVREVVTARKPVGEKVFSALSRGLGMCLLPLGLGMNLNHLHPLRHVLKGMACADIAAAREQILIGKSLDQVLPPVSSVGRRLPKIIAGVDAFAVTSILTLAGVNGGLVPDSVLIPGAVMAFFMIQEVLGFDAVRNFRAAALISHLIFDEAPKEDKDLSLELLKKLEGEHVPLSDLSEPQINRILFSNSVWGRLLAAARSQVCYGELDSVRVCAEFLERNHPTLFDLYGTRPSRWVTRSDWPVSPHEAAARADIVSDVYSQSRKPKK